MPDPRSRVDKRGCVRAGRSIRGLRLAFLIAVGLSLALPAEAAPRAGQFDRSFSGDGVAFTAFDPGGVGQVYGGGQVATRPSGKVVVAGSTRGSNTDYGVAQFRPSGKLDRSFGDQGTMTPRSRKSPTGLNWCCFPRSAPSRSRPVTR